MVKIKQKQFNDDLGKYLDTRTIFKPQKKTSEKMSFFKSSEEEVPELSETEVHIEYKEPSVFRRILKWRRRFKLGELEEDMSIEEKKEIELVEGEIESLEDEETQLESMEEEVEIRKEGLMDRLMTRLREIRIRRPQTNYVENFNPADYGITGEVKPSFDEDVTEVLKITYKWMEKLQTRHKLAFKASEDFQKYKDILTKYGIAKKK